MAYTAPKRITTVQPGRTITLDYQKEKDNQFIFCVVEWKHTGEETYHYKKTVRNYNVGLQLMNHIPPDMPQPIAQWVQENLPPADDEDFGRWMTQGGSPTPDPDKGGNDDDKEDNRGSGRRDAR
jgi:hypothetical protein